MFPEPSNQVDNFWWCFRCAALMTVGGNVHKAVPLGRSARGRAQRDLDLEVRGEG